VLAFGDARSQSIAVLHVEGIDERQARPKRTSSAIVWGGHVQTPSGSRFAIRMVQRREILGHGASSLKIRSEGVDKRPGQRARRPFVRTVQ
jgi:hypothetical protein